jgi:PAS domain S-box-containing protein
MTQPLRVLIVEDSEDDALLLELQLRQGGYVPAVRRVDTPAALVAALAEQRWDIVLSDFRLPGFDGLAALKTVRERAADVPFILVSGAVGEEQAVAAMKAGAHDFLVKDRLSRLVPAVDRELREAESRRQRRLANAVLRDSEERLRLVLHASGLGWWQWDFAADALVVDETVKTLFGLPIDAAVTFERVLDLTHPDDRPRLAERAAASRAQAGDYEVEARAVWPDGSIHWYFAKGRSYNGPGGKPSHAMGIAMDINERKATEEKLRRRAASLSLLSDIATHLLLDEHTESAIRGTIDKLARHLGMEVHFNYLVSDDGQYLRLNSCGGVDQPTRRALERLEFGEAVCGAVAQQRQRLVLEDVQHSTDPKAVSLRPLGLRAYVCHPLIARGRLIGTLSFGTRGRDRLSEEEYELLRTVCDQVAMALERNRLIAELEQRASDLAAAKTSAEQAKAAAEHANRAKDHFLAVLSHELRTPLTPVVMGVSMLQDRCDLDAAARETLAPRRLIGSRPTWPASSKSSGTCSRTRSNSRRTAGAWGSAAGQDGVQGSGFRVRTRVRGPGFRVRSLLVNNFRKPATPDLKP